MDHTTKITITTVNSANVTSAATIDTVAEPPTSNANKKRTATTLNFETLLIVSPKNTQATHP
jgi:hypothetical protein